MRKVLLQWEGTGEENIKRLSRYAEAVLAWQLGEAEILRLLPEIEAAIVLTWPSYMLRENLQKMTKLRFIQTVMVGVNNVPLRDLPAQVMVCNNGGAYSVEVGEHAWALLLSAAKRVVATNVTPEEAGKPGSPFKGKEKGIVVLKGRTMAILGFGGIGRVVAEYAKAFGMDVVALSRSRKKRLPGVRFLYGRRGLEQLLRVSDVILISLPLTKATQNLIGAKELGMMKTGAVLVNVARGDVIDQAALYAHVTANPWFSYATDVWWFKEGRETLETTQPLVGLPNFIGTPHTSGPTGLARGGPQAAAVDNTIRYLRGLAPRNQVDRSEYV